MLGAYGWILLGTSSFVFVMVSLLMTCTTHTFRAEHRDALLIFLGVFTDVDLVALCYVYALCRHVSRPLIGRFRRSVLEIFSVCVALSMRERMKADGEYFVLLVSATIYLHTVAQLSRVMPDLGLMDMMLGLLLEVIVYKSRSRMYDTIGVVVLCSIVILLRCWFYSAPIKPVDKMKKMDNAVGSC